LISPRLPAVSGADAHKICRNAPLAIKVTKELSQRRLNDGLEDGMRVYAALGRLLRTT